MWVTERFPNSYATCCAVVFPKDPLSIAASIILFPLIIDVVQMMIRFRAGVELLAWEVEIVKETRRTFFLLRNESQGSNFREGYATQKHDENDLLLATTSK